MSVVPDIASAGPTGKPAASARVDLPYAATMVRTGDLFPLLSAVTSDASLRARALLARDASRILAATSGGTRTHALRQIATALRDRADAILDANAADVARGRDADLAPSFLDRLTLDRQRIESMARAVDEIAAQPDPVGRIVDHNVRPNGLRVARVRTPLGVVAVIYEARPNVTSDAAALALRSGNAIILKGGRDATASNHAIGEVIGDALRASSLPEASVTVVTAADRDAIATLLTFDDLIDLVVPRGGEGLIRFVAEHSRIPVVRHYKGVCHIYADATADVAAATSIIVNAKASRPSVCNSAETLLVHADAAPTLLPVAAAALRDAGVTLHACERTRELLGDGDGLVPATDDDWAAEYLSLDLAVRVVPDMDAAIAHIARWGSDHTEAILSNDHRAIDEFTARVTSSCVVVNASTRFADGGELGLGAEIGISTSRVHAYGPMGADGLTTTRFVVMGDGHIR